MKNEIVKSGNDVTVLNDGSAFISQRRVAKLCGVNINAIQHQIKIGFVGHSNLNENNQIDSKGLVLLVTYYASKKQKAFETLAMFAEAGAKAFLYHEAGYVFDAKKNNSNPQLELEKAQAKLAYCSIDDNCPKAVFKLRDNKKVNLVYKDWVNLGWLVERKRMVETTDYLLTADGSECLEFKSGQIHVKEDMHQVTRLITHGARLAITGQSDFFIK